MKPLGRKSFIFGARLGVLLTVVLLLLSIVGTASATYNNVEYIAGIQARCELNHHDDDDDYKPSSFQANTGGGGGSSVIYRVDVGAIAQIPSSYKATGSGLLPAATPATGVTVKSATLTSSASANPIFSSSSANPIFTRSLTTSFAVGALNTNGTMTFKIEGGYHHPKNKLTFTVVFENTITHQTFTRIARIEGMPTTCNASTPTFIRITK